MENKIMELLNGSYDDVELNYEEENKVFYTGYIDADVEIRVEKLENNVISVSDRYLTDKHFVHYGNYKYIETAAAFEKIN